MERYLQPSDISKFRDVARKIKSDPMYTRFQDRKLNMVYTLYTKNPYYERHCKVVFFNAEQSTRLAVTTTQPRIYNPADNQIIYFEFVMNENGSMKRFKTDIYRVQDSYMEIRPKEGENEGKCLSTTYCPIDDSRFQMNFPSVPLREVYDLLKSEFGYNDQCVGPPLPPPPPEPPKPRPPKPPKPPEEEKCDTNGIHGGEGIELSKIEISLYVDSVTNGTVKLRRPQLEVGSLMSDWRPNPADTQKGSLRKIEELENKLKELTSIIETFRK